MPSPSITKLNRQMSEFLHTFNYQYLFCCTTKKIQIIHLMKSFFENLKFTTATWSEYIFQTFHIRLMQ